MADFKILEEKENPLFNRKEIKIGVEADVTPSHSDVKKLICEKFSSQVEKIKIKKIAGKFGSKVFVIDVNIYNSKEDLEKIEPKSKKEIKESKPEEKKVEEVKKEPEVKEDEKPKEEIKQKEKSSEELSEKNKTESEKKTE